jgi:hypothetical protein
MEAPSVRALRYLLFLLLCLAIPAAFAADVKISALPAASSANDSDEYPANQAGTTRKVTGAMIASLTTANINGASGTIGGRETWQTLNTNCAGNKTATLATCMTTNGLPKGTYRFEYTVIWEQNTATGGIKFAVGTDSAADQFVASWLYPDQGTTAVAGTADQVIAATAGAIYGHQSVRTNAGVMGPNVAVDTVNASILSTVYGVIRITKATGTASLYLSAAFGSAGGITVASGTTLNLRRLL